VQRTAKVPETDDPLTDVERIVPVFRLVCRAYPKLAQVMFSRPLSDLEPGPDELAAGASVREVFIGRIRRCVDTGLLAGDVTDIAHVLPALAQGLAFQEAGRWLGTRGLSVERRWKLGVKSLLNGFRLSR
jgi:hypothetical protein